MLIQEILVTHLLLSCDNINILCFFVVTAHYSNELIKYHISDLPCLKMFALTRRNVDHSSEICQLLTSRLRT